MKTFVESILFLLVIVVGLMTKTAWMAIPGYIVFMAYLGNKFPKAFGLK